MCFGIEFYKYYSCGENNFINIIRILKAFFPIFFIFFTFFKESSDDLKMKLCISLRNLSVFSVFSSLAFSTTVHKKINVVCKIRCLQTHRENKNGIVLKSALACL